VNWNTDTSLVTTRRFGAFAVAVASLAVLYAVPVTLPNAGNDAPIAVLVPFATVLVAGSVAVTSLSTDELYDIWRASGLVSLMLFVTLVGVYAALGVSEGVVIRENPGFATGLVLVATALTVAVLTTVPVAIGMFDRWRSEPPEELQP